MAGLLYTNVNEFWLGFTDGRQINVRRGQCGRADAFAQLAVASVVQTILGPCHVRYARRLGGVLGAGRTKPEPLLNVSQHISFEYENQKHQQSLQNVKGVRNVPQFCWRMENCGQQLKGPRDAHHDEEFHVCDVSEYKLKKD